MVIFQALVGCHDILILGKNPIKWRQCPDLTLAVDWDVMHQFNYFQHFDLAKAPLGSIVMLRVHTLSWWFYCVMCSNDQSMSV